MIRTGGGRFDPTEPSVYFLAGGVGNLEYARKVHPNLLIAVNELKGDGALEKIEEFLTDTSIKLFIDSGIFNLTNEHVRKHKGLSMDDALALAPDQIDGFDKLWARYLQVIERLADRAWGYIELDQGGRENKIKTRAKLEALGLKPIPVYHPLNDGWEYFDYLAERYDRICFGNIVQADQPTRKRLIATAWERHRKYPHLWIHFLGYTPSEYLHAFPVNSADSSTWLAGLRWNAVNIACDGKPFSRMDKNMRYITTEDGADNTNDLTKATMLSAYDAHLHQRNWRHHLACVQDLGCQLYPAPQEAA